jgi:hypothetical protein
MVNVLCNKCGEAVRIIPCFSLNTQMETIVKALQGKYNIFETVHTINVRVISQLKAQQ